MNVEQLKRNRASLVQAMRDIQTAVDARSDKTITAEESAKFNELRGQVVAVDDSIAREEFLAKQEAETALRADPVAKEERAKSLGEFICRFVKDPTSPRVDSRATTLGNLPSAGYFVPPEFDSVIRSLEPSQAIVRPRATVIPGGGASPDAPFMVTSFNQSGEAGVYGGITMGFVGEIAERQSAGDINLSQIELKPQQLIGYIDISNALLDNSTSAGAFAETQMRLAGIAKEEKAFISGTGVLQPTGFLGHPSNVTVTRGTANKIVFDDVVTMVSKATEGQNYVFIASKTTLPQLVALRDANNNNIWQPSAREGVPGTLLGYPVLFSERMSVLGTAGDLAFVDLTKYIIKDGSGISLMVDPYSRAINGITRLYFGWRVAGAPWLQTPLKSEDGVLRSPFVILS